MLDLLFGDRLEPRQLLRQIVATSGADLSATAMRDLEVEGYSAVPVDRRPTVTQLPTAELA